MSCSTRDNDIVNSILGDINPILVSPMFQNADDDTCKDITAQICSKLSARVASGEFIDYAVSCKEDDRCHGMVQLEIAILPDIDSEFIYVPCFAWPQLPI